MHPSNKTYCIDTVNLSSVFCVLRNTKRFDKIVILPATESFFQNIVVWFLKKMRRDCLKQSFQASAPRSQHALHRIKIFDFMKDYVEPELKGILSQYPWACDGELDTIVRYAAISQVRLYYQLFSLILLKRKFENDDFTLICSSQLNTMAFKKFASDEALNVITYRCMFYNPKARAGSYTDSPSKNYMMQSSRTFFALNICKKIAQLTLLFLKSRYFASPINPQGVDVIALLHQTQPHDGFNEVYWQNTAVGSKISTLGITAQYDDSNIFAYYKKLRAIKCISRLLSIYPANWVIDSCHKSFVEVFKLYIRKLFWAIKSAAKNQMDFQISHAIIDLEFKSSFYQWLLKTYDAKIFWTIVEGNNVDAVAMTIASKRAQKLTIGASWSLSYGFQDITFADAKCQLFLSWGEFQRLNRVRSYALHKKYIEVGYQGIDTVQKSKSTTKHELKTICFFDSVYGSDTFCDLEILQGFIDVMKDWTSKNPGFNLVIKAKRKESIINYVDLPHHINHQQGDLSDGLDAEIVIGYHCVSPANICAAYGKKVILIDHYHLVPHSIAQLPNVRVIKDVKELGVALDAMLNSVYKKHRPTKTVIDTFADFSAPERTACILKYVINEFNKRSGPEEILSKVDELEYNADFQIN